MAKNTTTNTEVRVLTPKNLEEANQLMRQLTDDARSISRETNLEYGELNTLQEKIDELLKEMRSVQERINEKVGEKIDLQKQRIRALDAFIKPRVSKLLQGNSAGTIKLEQGLVEIKLCPESLECEGNDEHAAGVFLIKAGEEIYTDCRLKKQLIRMDLARLVDKGAPVGMGNNQMVEYKPHAIIPDRLADIYRIKWIGEITEQ